MHVRVSSNALTSVPRSRASHLSAALNRAEWRGGGGGVGAAVRFSYGQSGNCTRRSDPPGEGKREREEKKKDLIRFPLEFTWLENKKGAG